MRYFLKFSYNGKGYCGWQRQPNALSVQEVIEGALSKVLGTPTSVTGAGRTDAGVHAMCMYAHFDSPEPITDSVKLLRSLNHLCGRQIAFQAIYPVADDAHARFDATERTYKYFVSREKSPFTHELVWQAPYELDYNLMNEAAQILLSVDDFTSFSKLHTDVKTNICKVIFARWEPHGNGWVFTITADRFLRNMVRAVVGTLVDIGRKKITLADFRRIIEQKNRCAAGTSMPAHALYLWNVKYSYIPIAYRSLNVCRTMK